MNEVERLIGQLKEAILNSDEYKEYRVMEDIISRHPDLKRAVDDYRRENFFYQYSDDVGDVLGVTESLSDRFSDIRKQPFVEHYLSAEMSICRMIQRVIEDVTESVDFNMDFLHDEF